MAPPDRGPFDPCRARPRPRRSFRRDRLQRAVPALPGPRARGLRAPARGRRRPLLPHDAAGQWQDPRRPGDRATARAPHAGPRANDAIQGQWLAEWAGFEPSLVAASASPDLAAPVTVLTYQALAVLDRGAGDDGAGLAGDRAARSAQDRRRERVLVARGGDRDQVLGLLHPNGRAVVARLAGLGAVTLVLDECHHLLALWGHVLEAIIGELPSESAVVGLTATPPLDLVDREAASTGACSAGAPTTRRHAGGRQGRIPRAVPGARIPHPADRGRGALDRPPAGAVRRAPRRPARSYVRDCPVRRMVRDPSARAPVPGRGAGGWATLERDSPELARAALRWLWEQGQKPPAGAGCGRSTAGRPTPRTGSRSSTPTARTRSGRAPRRTTTPRSSGSAGRCRPSATSSRGAASGPRPRLSIVSSAYRLPRRGRRSASSKRSRLCSGTACGRSSCATTRSPAEKPGRHSEASWTRAPGAPPRRCASCSAAVDGGAGPYPRQRTDRRRQPVDRAGPHRGSPPRPGDGAPIRGLRSARGPEPATGWEDVILLDPGHPSGHPAAGSHS